MNIVLPYLEGASVVVLGPHTRRSSGQLLLPSAFSLAGGLDPSVH